MQINAFRTRPSTRPPGFPASTALVSRLRLTIAINRNASPINDSASTIATNLGHCQRVSTTADTFHPATQEVGERPASVGASPYRQDDHNTESIENKNE
jgi:hypothetical protein